MKIRYYVKRFGTDIAGYGLIILGVLTGWLPGPGGIPLILAGLGLLSIHNHWARRLLLFTKNNASRFMEYIFPENPIAKAAHDAVAIVLVSAAIYIFVTKDTFLDIGITISLLALATVDFLYNRKRWVTFKSRTKQR